MSEPGSAGMVPSYFDVTGKTALVTGASSGLGAHFARVLARHGAAVALAARRQERLTDLAAEIETAGGRAAAVSMDVTDPASVAAAFDAAESALGPVAILANNAGVADAKLAVDIDEASWDFVVDTNLKGAWLAAREAGRRMIAGGSGGAIVNTASILGLGVGVAQASYAASKAGVVQLTRSLALEWGRKGVRVNALCPGYFETEMNSAYLRSEKGRAYLAGTPPQRSGALEELSAPFMLLASDAGSYMNGVALPVDGGHLLGGL